MLRILDLILWTIRTFWKVLSTSVAGGRGAGEETGGYIWEGYAENIYKTSVQNRVWTWRWRQRNNRPGVIRSHPGPGWDACGKDWERNRTLARWGRISKESWGGGARGLGDHQEVMLGHLHYKAGSLPCRITKGPIKANLLSKINSNLHPWQRPEQPVFKRGGPSVITVHSLHSHQNSLATVS